jgi:lysozyme
MHISDRGLALIKEFEGFEARPYWLGDGRWTIGYGETLGISKNTGPWTQAYANARLRIRVQRDFEPFVARLGLRLNQHQFDALVSFAYNLGPGYFDKSHSIGAALRSRKDAGWVARVQKAIKLYDMPGSKFHEGLARRRAEEAKLFGSPVESAEDRKRARLTVELDRLRAWVRLNRKGDWGHAPKRKVRAEYIKHWLGSHPKV